MNRAALITTMAAVIREIDGAHRLGAGELAEALVGSGLTITDPAEQLYATAVHAGDGTVQPVSTPSRTSTEAENELADEHQQGVLGKKIRELRAEVERLRGCPHHSWSGDGTGRWRCDECGADQGSQDVGEIRHQLAQANAEVERLRDLGVCCEQCGGGCERDRRWGLL